MAGSNVLQVRRVLHLKTGTYNRRVKGAVDRLLLRIADVTERKMFGYPAYFVGGRLVACHYGNAVGVKVSPPLAGALIKAGRAKPFQPHGKSRMREWIQVSGSTKSLQNAADIFMSAIEYARRPKKHL